MGNENLKLPPEIEQLTQKLVADPKSRVFAQLADAYRKAGMTDEAIETAKKGLEHHPNYPAAHLILGRCYLEKQMYALAREEFEATIKSDPQNLVGYKLLAGTYEKQNMFAEAVKFYQMVLDLEPSDSDLVEKVAALKAKQDERPQAAPEPEPEPVQQPVPVLEIVREEPEPAPVKEEPVMAAEEKPAETKPGEPAKEETPVSNEPILFPEALAETKPEPEPETKPVEAAPPAEAKPEEPVKMEAPVSTEPVLFPEALEETKPEPEPVKAEGPEAKPEEKPKAVEDAGKPGEATVTLAEIYVQQGFFEKAIEVYKELISAEPENDDYKTRMDELLEKAYPEEKPAETAEEKKEPETPAKEEPTAPEIPAAESEAKKEPVKEAAASPLPEAPPAVDIFGGMFDKLEKPEPKTEEPKAEETKAVQPEEPSKPVASIPVPEEKPEPQPAPEPAKEPPADFSALFSDSPKPDESKAAAGPAMPEAGSEKKAEGENTVSSFQSWLSSLQK